MNNPSFVQEIAELSFWQRFIIESTFKKNNEFKILSMNKTIMSLTPLFEKSKSNVAIDDIRE